jgi:hypothetical protein
MGWYSIYERRATIYRGRNVAELLQTKSYRTSVVINFINDNSAGKQLFCRKRAVFYRRCQHEMVTIAKTLIECSGEESSCRSRK